MIICRREAIEAVLSHSVRVSFWFTEGSKVEEELSIVDWTRLRHTVEQRGVDLAAAARAVTLEANQADELDQMPQATGETLSVASSVVSTKRRTDCGAVEEAQRRAIERELTRGES